MMKHPEFDQMVALAERLRLELDSYDRKNLVGSQIIPDKSNQAKLFLGDIHVGILTEPLTRHGSKAFLPFE
jgi:hypothetical protein